MSKETEQASEPNEVQIDDAAAERDFAAAGDVADKQVAAQSDDGSSDNARQSSVDNAEKLNRDKAEPTDAKIVEKDEKKNDEVEQVSDAQKAKNEAVQTAQEQQEAEQRAVVAAEAEKARKAQEAAQKASESAPLDVANISNSVRDRIKNAKIEGYENFEAFEKEYGKPLTDVISAVAYEVAKSMVAPIVQERQQERVEAAHNQFIGKMTEIGHTDVAVIEKSPEFWSWLDKAENSQLKYLVEKADIKGTDMVLRAYKAEKGLTTAPAKAQPTEREKLVAAQDEARRRSDAVHTITGRRKVDTPAKQSTGDEITDQESAEALFNDTVNEQNKNSRR